MKLLPVYLIVFFFLVLINYYLGIFIEQSVRKRIFIFIIGICLNITVLAFFKYFGIFQSLITGIKSISGGDHILKIILPVGLSFFIFTILSYLIEVKRGTIKAERHFGVFITSLLFFPKIMQGPIEKPGNIFLQFHEAKNFNYMMVVDGLKLMLWGYFKKLVVADRLAIYVNAVYNNYDHHTGITLLIATVFYSFQIYADFSGYTDIALGSAKILGFNLTNNFNRPYFATTIREFWNRWHISLSVWLRDYLFLPLAVIFTNKMRSTSCLGISAEKWIFMFATIITFAICGIWHGEGLNFLIWGLLFGLYLTMANWTLRLNKKLRKALRISERSLFYRMFEAVVTFALVTFTWIFFRADTSKEAILIIKNIFSFKGPLFFDYPTFSYGLFAIVVLLIVEIKEERETAIHSLRTNHWFKEQVGFAVLAALILLIGVFDGGQFIYFQF